MGSVTRETDVRVCAHFHVRVRVYMYTCIYVGTGDKTRRTNPPIYNLSGLFCRRAPPKYVSFRKGPDN